MAKFSKHAFERTENRLSLSHREVSNILDNDKTINIGVEESSRRVHKLFYSQPDGVPFVAVQDEKCGTIVTILPIDYHNRCAWHVSYDAQKEAQAIITGVPHETNKQMTKSMVSEVVNGGGHTPSFYRLGATDFDTKRNYNLGTIRREKEKDTPETLLMSEGFADELKARVAEKCTETTNLDRLEIRISTGKNAMPIFLPYADAIEYKGYDEILRDLKRR